MATRKVFRLSDSAIACIVRALQQALLTGTDSTDHFRMMRLEAMREEPDALVMTEEYLANEEDLLDRLEEEAEALAALEQPNDACILRDIADDEVLFVNGTPISGDGGKHGPN